MPLRRLHNLGQNPAHVLGMDEENQRPMRANAGFAQHALTQRLKLSLRDMNIGHFVTDMMLPAGRVLVEEALDRRVSGQRLDQFNLRAVERAFGTRCINKADLHALFGKVERIMDLRRAHYIAVKDDAVCNGGRCDANMVETA